MTRSFLLRLSAAILLLFTGFPPSVWGQTCSGSFGDPVINITFGSGSNPGSPLQAATTSYQYVTNSCPQDGYYTLVNYTSGCNGNTWHTISQDHTGGKPNGYFMLINASYTPSDFYLDKITGLCSGTTYRFAAWITNVLVPSACGGAGIKPNVTFRIETPSGTVLASYNTGDIAAENIPTWHQYSLDFTVPAGVTDIVLRMTNNSVGGCGNDLALDDITFSPCGPKAQAGITGNNGLDSIDVCFDAQPTLNFTGNVSAGYLTPSEQWQISTDTGTTWVDIPGATGLSLTRTPGATSGLFLYRMNVGDGGNVLLPTCRVASNVIAVRVWPKPVPAAINNGPVCQGAQATLKAFDGKTFSWTGPNGFTSSDSSPVIPNAPPAADGLYQVLVTNAGGCTQTGSTTLTILPSPIADFVNNKPPCEKTALSFIDRSSATGSQTLSKWRWDFGDGSIDSVQNPAHTYTNPGTYPVSLIATTDHGCANTVITRSITVHDKPLANFGTPRICLADPTGQFTDSSSIADGTQNAFTWFWNFGDPGAAPGTNSSSLKDPTHKYSAAGPYNVNLTVVSNNGCVTDTTKTFTVNGSNPQPAFTVDPALLCSNQPVTLVDNSSVSPGNIVRTLIYWDYQNDPTINTDDASPAPGKDHSHAYPYFSNPSTVTYQLHYIVYSGQTCLNQVVQNIVLNASPKTAFDAIPPVCEEIQPYLLTEGHETQGMLLGTPVYQGKGVRDDGTFTPRIAGPGTTELKFIYTAANGCADTSRQTVLVYPQPHADAGTTEYFLEGGQMTLSGSGTGNNITYAWTPADSILDDPHSTHPRIAPHDDISFTLTVTSADGCTDSASVKVIVLKIPIVPNAFSPNGDGINDTWIIHYLEEYPHADVRVFNRYGQPVYQAIGYTRPWDGTTGGRPLPVGTYYWIINPGNGRKQISGSVTILR